MTTHPNRNRGNRTLGQNPTPEEVRVAREISGLTAKQAGLAVFRSLRTWQSWEMGERSMPADSFCLFLLITGQVPLDLVLEASDKARGLDVQPA